MNQKAAPSVGKKVVQYAVVLTGICLVCTAGVAILYVMSKARIAQNAASTFRGKLKDVLGDAQDPQPLGAAEADPLDDVNVARTENGVRYAATGAAQGYQSQVSVLVSVDAPSAEASLGDDPTIYRLVVLDSKETPGLGEEIRKVQSDTTLWGMFLGKGGDTSRRPAFQEQFSGKKLSDLVVDAKDSNRIVPITGATITSRATTNAARLAVQRIIQKTQEMHGKAASKEGNEKPDSQTAATCQGGSGKAGSK
jgi:Na+-translocating ferredoxin:NAD+ oxidoreductase RnfG subunit